MADYTEEIFRQIDDTKFYVSNMGIIINTNYLNRGETKITSQYLDKKNYCRISIRNSKEALVHRIVARAFPEICGEWFDGCDVEHINCITTDNRAENLRVCTHKENMNNPITKENCRKGVYKHTPNFKGHKHTEYSLKLISQNRKGIPCNKETKEKISIANKNNPAYSKPVFQYSLDGILIKEFPSAMQVKRELGFNNAHISLCCNGKRKSAQGYIWRYKE